MHTVVAADNEGARLEHHVKKRGCSLDLDADEGIAGSIFTRAGFEESLKNDCGLLVGELLEAVLDFAVEAVCDRLYSCV